MPAEHSQEHKLRFESAIGHLCIRVVDGQVVCLLNDEALGKVHCDEESLPDEQLASRPYGRSAAESADLVRVGGGVDEKGVAHASQLGIGDDLDNPWLPARPGEVREGPAGEYAEVEHVLAGAFVGIGDCAVSNCGCGRRIYHLDHGPDPVRDVPAEGEAVGYVEGPVELAAGHHVAVVCDLHHAHVCSDVEALVPALVGEFEPARLGLSLARLRFGPLLSGLCCRTLSLVLARYGVRLAPCEGHGHDRKQCDD